MSYRPSVPSSAHSPPGQFPFELPSSERNRGAVSFPPSTPSASGAQSGGGGLSRGHVSSNRVPLGKPPRGLPAAVELLACFGSIRAQVCVVAIVIGLFVPIAQYVRSALHRSSQVSQTRQSESPAKPPAMVEATVVSIENPKTVELIRERIEHPVTNKASHNARERAADPYDDETLDDSRDSPSNAANTDDDPGRGAPAKAKVDVPGKVVTEFTQYVRQDYTVTYEYMLDDQLYRGKYETKRKPYMAVGDSIRVEHSPENLVREESFFIDPFEDWPFDPKYFVLVIAALPVLAPEIVRGAGLIRLLRKGYYGAGIVTGAAKLGESRWRRRPWYRTIFDVRVAPTSGQLATVAGGAALGVGVGAHQESQRQQVRQWQSVGAFAYESTVACPVSSGGVMPVLFEVTNERSCTPLCRLPFGINVKDNGDVVLDPVRLLTLIPTLVVIVIAVLLGV